MWRSLAARFAPLLDYPALFYAVRFLLVGRQRPTKERLRAVFAETTNRSVLDVCCGMGEFAGSVDARYIGLDMNARFIAHARRAHRGSPSKTFQVGDATALPFADRSFDVTMAVNCLHHFAEADAARLLAELQRVTRELVLIVDIDGTRRGVVRRALLAMDRGRFTRTPSQLVELVSRVLPVSSTTRWDVGLYTEVAIGCRVRPPGPLRGSEAAELSLTGTGR